MPQPHAGSDPAGELVYPSLSCLARGRSASHAGHPASRGVCGHPKILFVPAAPPLTTPSIAAPAIPALVTVLSAAAMGHVQTFWILPDHPCSDPETVQAPNPASSPPESQTPALTYAFPLLSWEELIWEIDFTLISALSSFVNTLLYDTRSLVGVRNYLDSSCRDQEERQSRIPAQLYPKKEQRVYFSRDKYHIKPLVTLKVGPKEEAFQFSVDLGAEITCIMKNPIGCEVGKEILEMVTAENRKFEVPIIKDVAISNDNKRWMGNILLIPELGPNVLGKDLEALLGVGVVPEGW